MVKHIVENFGSPTSHVNLENFTYSVVHIYLFYFRTKFYIVIQPYLEPSQVRVQVGCYELPQNGRKASSQHYAKKDKYVSMF